MNKCSCDTCAAVAQEAEAEAFDNDATHDTTTTDAGGGDAMRDAKSVKLGLDGPAVRRRRENLGVYNENGVFQCRNRGFP